MQAEDIEYTHACEGFSPALREALSLAPMSRSADHVFVIDSWLQHRMRGGDAFFRCLRPASLSALARSGLEALPYNQFDVINWQGSPAADVKLLLAGRVSVWTDQSRQADAPPRHLPSSKHVVAAVGDRLPEFGTCHAIVSSQSNSKVALGLECLGDFHHNTVRAEEPSFLLSIDIDTFDRFCRLDMEEDSQLKQLALQECPLLTNLDLSELRSLSDHMYFAAFQPREVIYAQGSVVSDVFLVVQGEVHLSQSVQKQNKPSSILVSSAGAGRIIGCELPLIENKSKRRGHDTEAPVARHAESAQSIDNVLLLVMSSEDVRRHLPQSVRVALRAEIDALSSLHAARVDEFCKNEELNEFLVSNASPSRIRPAVATSSAGRLLAAVTSASPAADSVATVSSKYQNIPAPIISEAPSSKHPIERFISPAMMAGVSAAFPFTLLNFPSAAHERMANALFKPLPASKLPRTQPKSPLRFSASLPAPLTSAGLALSTPSVPIEIESDNLMVAQPSIQFQESNSPLVSASYIFSDGTQFQAPRDSHQYWLQQRQQLDSIAAEQLDPKFSTDVHAYLTDPSMTMRVGSDGRPVPPLQLNVLPRQPSPVKTKAVVSVDQFISSLRDDVSLSASPLSSGRSSPSLSPSMSPTLASAQKISSLQSIAEQFDDESDGEFEARRQRRMADSRPDAFRSNLDHDLPAVPVFASALRAALSEKREGATLAAAFDTFFNIASQHVEKPSQLSDVDHVKLKAKRVLLEAFEKQRAVIEDSKARWQQKLASMQPPPPAVSSFIHPFRDADGNLHAESNVLEPDTSQVAAAALQSMLRALRTLPVHDGDFGRSHDHETTMMATRQVKPGVVQVELPADVEVASTSSLSEAQSLTMVLESIGVLPIEAEQRFRQHSGPLQRPKSNHGFMSETPVKTNRIVARQWTPNAINARIAQQKIEVEEQRRAAKLRAAAQVGHQETVEGPMSVTLPAPRETVEEDALNVSAGSIVDESALIPAAQTESVKGESSLVPAPAAATETLTDVNAVSPSVKAEQHAKSHLNIGDVVSKSGESQTVPVTIPPIRVAFSPMLPDPTDDSAQNLVDDSFRLQSSPTELCVQPSVTAVDTNQPVPSTAELVSHDLVHEPLVTSEFTVTNSTVESLPVADSPPVLSSESQTEGHPAQLVPIRKLPTKGLVTSMSLKLNSALKITPRAAVESRGTVLNNGMMRARRADELAQQQIELNRAAKAAGSAPRILSVFAAKGNGIDDPEEIAIGRSHFNGHYMEPIRPHSALASPGRNVWAPFVKLQAAVPPPPQPSVNPVETMTQAFAEYAQCAADLATQHIGEEADAEKDGIEVLQRQWMIEQDLVSSSSSESESEFDSDSDSDVEMIVEDVQKPSRPSSALLHSSASRRGVEISPVKQLPSSRSASRPSTASLKSLLSVSRPASAAKARESAIAVSPSRPEPMSIALAASSSMTPVASARAILPSRPLSASMSVRPLSALKSTGRASPALIASQNITAPSIGFVPISAISARSPSLTPTPMLAVGQVVNSLSSSTPSQPSGRQSSVRQPPALAVEAPAIPQPGSAVTPITPSNPAPSKFYSSSSTSVLPSLPRARISETLDSSVSPSAHHASQFASLNSFASLSGLRTSQTVVAKPDLVKLKPTPTASLKASASLPALNGNSAAAVNAKDLVRPTEPEKDPLSPTHQRERSSWLLGILERAAGSESDASTAVLLPVPAPEVPTTPPPPVGMHGAQSSHWVTGLASPLAANPTQAGYSGHMLPRSQLRPIPSVVNVTRSTTALTPKSGSGSVLPLVRASRPAIFSSTKAK